MSKILTMAASELPQPSPSVTNAGPDNLLFPPPAKPKRDTGDAHGPEITSSADAGNNSVLDKLFPPPGAAK
jgi:hypothetical protein